MNTNNPDGFYPYPTRGIMYPSPPGDSDLDNGNPDQDEDEIEDEIEDEDEEYEGDNGDLYSWGFGVPSDSMIPDEELKEESDRDSYESDEDSTPSVPGQGTFGVELEFLVVQCAKPRMRGGELIAEDRHPDDYRWISTKMAKWEVDEFKSRMQDGIDIIKWKHKNGTYWDDLDADAEWRRFQYSRTRLTRILRNKGLVVIKWPDEEMDGRHIEFVQVNEFSDSEATDDEQEEAFPNSARLGNFSSYYDYDPSESMRRNALSAVLRWETDFIDYHETNDLKMYRTRLGDIKEAVTSQCHSSGEWPAGELQSLRETADSRLRLQREMAKQARENRRNQQVDPLHVAVQNLSPKYKAWTVTVDFSVDGNGMVAERYSNAHSVDPFEDYHWFGAEVVSPVLPTGDERARQAIRVACGALRDTLRCHKPMEVSTGLHIHLGHTHGWTLLQAKRFATFWFLAEETILQLHRKDRDQDRKWCAKIKGGSRLWLALHSDKETERQRCSHTMARRSEDERSKFETEMLDNVPSRESILTQVQEEFLYYLWQFNTILALHNGLGENQYCKTGVKWRIRGVNSSLESHHDMFEETQPGTIEIRVMQGTLDADHINNWIVVLEHIVDAVRDLPDRDFREFLRKVLRNQTRAGLLTVLRVPDDVREYWLDPRRRDAEDNWWEYPDQDKVDWANPFMVPGHKATHGSFWD